MTPGGITRSGLRVRAVPLAELRPDAIAAWSALEERSLEPSAYLSPHFVLPALRYLEPERAATALLVEEQGAGSSGGQPPLAGVLIVHSSPGSRRFPVPHLVAYQSAHSFQTGLLLDRTHAEEALVALLEYIRARGPRCNGVQFRDLWQDGPTSELLAGACERLRMHRLDWDPYERAVVFAHAQGREIDASVAAATKEQRRKIRKLGEMGEVRWSLVTGGPAWQRAVETFLDLEHQGWRGEQGSSLRSTMAGEAFFRAMASSFASEGRALFAELSLKGQVIASTSNFRSGRWGFAFKIGWLPAFRNVSPGLQTELGLLRSMGTHELLKPIEFWDSGASEGCYLERLWPGRRRLGQTAFASTHLGEAALRLVQGARFAKRKLGALRTPPAAPANAADDASQAS